MSRPGGASLDGEPPASALPQPSREPRPGPRPWTSTCAVQRGPGGAPIDGSSALHLPPAALSTARRACDTTSGVLCRTPRRTRHCCRIPVAAGHQERSPPPPRQRRRPAPFPDAFHRRVLPPPVVPDACASCAWDRGEPATGVAARVLGGFRHRDPASGAVSPAELPRLGGRASRLDPDLSIRTGRRSSTSATNANREHDHGSPDPRPSYESMADVRLRAPPASPSGVPPPRDRTERRSRSLAGRPIPAPGTVQRPRPRTWNRSPTPSL
jgi:hypothetical protein